MFAKPQKISGTTLLKNKDVKKLKKDLVAKFPQTCTEEALQPLFAGKASVKRMNFQAPSRMVVYALEETAEPIAFDPTGKGDLCFTVYALWKLAAFLPPLVVHAPVSQFVLRGADVMLPGVVFTSLEDVASLRKGQVRAVYARGNPAPFAIGEVMVDANDMAKHGKKGRALTLWHHFGDELWKMGPQTIPNAGFQEQLVVPIDGTLSDDDEDDEDDETEGQDQTKNDTNAIDLSQVTLEEPTKPTEESENSTVSKEEMDQLFVRTLLQAFKSSRVKEKQFPMLSSAFYSTILLPARPAGVQLNIKQSSYKKISTFLKEMQANGLLHVTEKDGVQTITAISKRHPDVLAHESFQTDADAQDEQAMRTAQAQPAVLHSAAVQAGDFAPEVEEAYGLSQAIRFMLQQEQRAINEKDTAVDLSKKIWTGSYIRHVITLYIEALGLANANDKKFVRLNGPLTDAVFNRNPPAGGYPEQMTRPELLAELMKCCTKYHRIKLYPNHDPKFHGGELKPMEVHVERGRHGKSLVTIFSYFHQFGIDGPTFIKESQKKWGCSVTIQPSADKSKKEEIKIQGDMANELVRCLQIKYKIHAKYCKVSYANNVKPKKK